MAAKHTPEERIDGWRRSPLPQACWIRPWSRLLFFRHMFAPFFGSPDVNSQHGETADRVRGTSPGQKESGEKSLLK